MEKRYQVFVSSTYADLQDERKKVIQTLLELDCIPAGMELFPATDEDQFEFIKRIIDDCDYYLLIIGGRYGSVTAEGISYTELEYEYALERGLKVIALLHEKPEQIPFVKSEQNPDLRIRLQGFRDKAATGRVVKFWQHKEELPGIVALSLSKTIKLFPAVGWVRADKVSSEELLIEINELRKQNELMKEQLAAIEPSIFSGSEEKDFSYIYNQLNRFENIEIKIRQRTKPNENEPDLNINYSINLASLIPIISKSDNHEYKWYLISDKILREIFQNQTEREKYSVVEIENMDSELLRYGLLTKNYIPPVPMNGNDPFRSVLGMNRGDVYRLIFSEKLERYKYWLSVNDKIPERIQIIKME
ncbi:MAG: DUF4062 domain-containing protein [Methylovulum sp.]|nr:DUF4062 domain-containing protein [Methylovulum sp.]